MNHFLTIAMDGGAASGKSSTSRALAERHNLMHVDTGAHYRSITYAVLAAAAAPAFAPTATAPAPATPLSAQLEPAVLAWLATPAAALGTHIEGRTARLTVGGVLPADADLRTERINARVSHIAAIPAVRRHLYEYQRAQRPLARERGYAGLIMEGRDIGTVIFPDADLRIFLEADPIARAARAAAEGRADAVAARDKLDSSRATAPLAVAPGAIRIDSTHLLLPEVVDKISTLIREKTGCEQERAQS